MSAGRGRHRLTYHRVPMPDTGLGKELGYADDRAFRQHMAMERATLPPEIRAALDEMERRLTRQLLFGDDLER